MTTMVIIITLLCLPSTSYHKSSMTTFSTNETKTYTHWMSQ